MKCISHNLALHIVLVDHLLKTEEIQKFKETGDSRKSYQEQDMACFQHDIASGDLKDLPWSKIASDKSK